MFFKRERIIRAEIRQKFHENTIYDDEMYKTALLSIFEELDLIYPEIRNKVTELGDQINLDKVDIQIQLKVDQKNNINNTSQHNEIFSEFSPFLELTTSKLIQNKLLEGYNKFCQSENNNVPILRIIVQVVAYKQT